MPEHKISSGYVEEMQPVPQIEGAPTSIAVFLGIFQRGPTNAPVLVNNYNEFESNFGGLHHPSEASYAVCQFFLNGGGKTWIVRIPEGKESTMEPF